ncbi:hypothetical protein KJ596_01620 [Patescibacteria group bacterium]|nr:hypothetical protein [Patescibacteria group bacterium]MBU1868239.1 hypothetical protein [Patescibacteria group bacterium]
MGYAKGRSQLKGLFFGSLLIVVACGSRVLLNRLHLAINVELVTLSTLLAAVYLGKAWGVLVPLTSMMLSDRIIGNSNIYLFTWSAYAIIGLLSLTHKELTRYISQFSNIPALVNKLLAIISLGVFSSLFFYIWTNFGVWYQGWYEPTFKGLIKCYLMGLPFLKYNLIGNLVLVTFVFGLAELVFSGLPRLSGSRKVFSYE